MAFIGPETVRKQHTPRVIKGLLHRHNSFVGMYTLMAVVLFNSSNKASSRLLCVWAS